MKSSQPGEVRGPMKSSQPGSCFQSIVTSSSFVSSSTLPKRYLFIFGSAIDFMVVGKRYFFRFPGFSANTFSTSPHEFDFGRFLEDRVIDIGVALLFLVLK